MGGICVGFGEFGGWVCWVTTVVRVGFEVVVALFVCVFVGVVFGVNFGIMELVFIWYFECCCFLLFKVRYVDVGGRGVIYHVWEMGQV
jgi:hypothetical protein